MANCSGREHTLNYEYDYLLLIVVLLRISNVTFHNKKKENQFVVYSTMSSFFYQ